MARPIVPPAAGAPPVPEGAAREGGFTLLELIIVLTVIGILATIAVPAFKDVPRRAQEAALRTNLRTMCDAIDQYHADKGRYPPSLESLVEDGYLRFVPLDPFTKTADTWQVEYEEPDYDEDFGGFDDFEEGAEPGVVDVYSGAELQSLRDRGLYSEWRCGQY
ncbi:MAG TPA: prepilin-type N-terminal cleavage/methylation domain-containing protein [Thermoanaerobaculia bacterium]|nr:prepilin-type N-terminal cleavage/methylation domain-containing protein [Thermoanaerobaculia bacterium]